MSYIFVLYNGPRLQEVVDHLPLPVVAGDVERPVLPADVFVGRRRVPLGWLALEYHLLHRLALLSVHIGAQSQQKLHNLEVTPRSSVAELCIQNESA